MHSPRTAKRPGPLPFQKRLHRVRQERRMEAWHKASLNLHAAMKRLISQQATVAAQQSITALALTVSPSPDPDWRLP